MAIDPLQLLFGKPEEEPREPGQILMSLIESQPAPVAQGGGGGGGAPNAPQGGDIESMVKRMAQKRYGWSGKQWDALHELVSRESSWNPQADNPTSTAYGLFQFLDSTRKNYGIGLGASPKGQAKAGLKYVQDRYGDPLSALRFHSANNYY